MGSNKLVRIRVPRETLIRGRLRGKYRSELHEQRSYSDLDRYYVLHVYECEITDGKPAKEDEFDPGEKLNRNIHLLQPVMLSASINDEMKHFRVSFKSYEISNPVLFDVVSEGRNSFGSIEAEIKGIVEDHKEIDVPEEELEPTGKEEEKEEEGKTFRQKEYVYMHRGKRVPGYGAWENVDPLTIRKERSFSQSNEGSGLIAGSEQRYPSVRFTRLFFGFISALLLYAGFPFLWPFILLAGLFWLLRLLSIRIPLFGGFIRKGILFGARLTTSLFSLIGLAFWGFVIYSLLNTSACRSAERSTGNVRGEQKAEVKRREASPGKKRAQRVATHKEKTGKGEKGDGITEWISHPFTWYDYQDNEYSGVIAVRKKDYHHSMNTRNTLEPGAVFPENYWNSIYYQLSDHDNSGMDSICSMLDHIRTDKALDARAFADVIVSCVQHMPYELIMEGSCKPGEYDKPFIRSYLDKGGRCECCSRFGLNAPVEFAANFAGDCDTRTLMLFTLLNRFGYDAMILNSDVHGHSVLGVNLPARGVAKSYRGNRYFIWETTAKGMELGQFPPHLSDMNAWYIALTNKNE